MNAPLSIAELLDAPDSALLLAVDGGITLVTIRHETETRTVIDRPPLGALTTIDAVLAVLGRQDRPPVVLAPASMRPVLAVPTGDETRRYGCPACGRSYRYPSDLARHQKTCRGRIYKAEEPVACDLCDRTFTTRVGLATHKARVHTGSTWSTRKKTEASPEPAAQAPVTTPAEAAPVTPESTDAPQAVLVDLPLVTAPPIAFEVPPLRKAAPVADGVCETCHEPLISHDECDVCNSLIGPGHATEQPVFVSGLDLCHDCAREHVTRRRAELRQETAA